MKSGRIWNETRPPHWSGGTARPLAKGLDISPGTAVEPPIGSGALFFYHPPARRFPPWRQDLGTLP